jgi:surfactin synthase thioesterase subunit
MGAHARLVCLPYAGGGASLYSSWAVAAPSALDVVLVQPPGREERYREQPFTEMDALIDSLAASIAPLMRVPIVFFGHSMGALVAFELARRIRSDNGVEPAHLFVSGCRAPHLPRNERPLHRLPDDALVDELSRRASHAAVLLKDPRWVDAVLPVVRADLQVCETYVYRTERPFSCPLTALAGEDDPTLSDEELPAWADHTSGAFSVRRFPGDHLYLLDHRRHVLDMVLWRMPTATHA